jgi:Flp pilus assembly protein protease CpaA
MLPSFYPDPIFGWTFYGILVGLLVVATYTDLARFKIPKKLTLTMLALGVLLSVVRGAWLGHVYQGNAEGKVVWFFATSPGLGALEGLLFALAGFAVGFALFYPLWLIGQCGGGDVKLVAALGVWVGPKWICLLVFGSLTIFLLLALVRIARKAMRRGLRRTIVDAARPGAGAARKKVPVNAHTRDKLIAKSLPVALATAVLLPLLTATDLHLTAAKATPSAAVSTPQR